jgi:hypothetical protein
MKKLVVICLMLASCSKGPEVVQRQVSVQKWSCEYSDSRFSRNRTVAICETSDECNKLCAALPKAD